MTMLASCCASVAMWGAALILASSLDAPQIFGPAPAPAALAPKIWVTITRAPRWPLPGEQRRQALLCTANGRPTSTYQPMPSGAAVAGHTCPLLLLSCCAPVPAVLSAVASRTSAIRQLSPIDRDLLAKLSATDVCC